MSESKKQFHTIPPVFGSDSKVLVLGSFPSVRSRETGFYYGHPQNRFWRVLAETFSEEVPTDITSKKEFLYRHKIALWDVISSCEIKGSGDTSIKNEEYNDLKVIFSAADIKAVFCTGKLAYNLYEKLNVRLGFGKTGIYLPSPSAANAAVKKEDLVKEYSAIKNYTE